MTAWVFEARFCPTLLNEIKKTKLQTYTEPQAGINILLCVRALIPNLHEPHGLASFGLREGSSGLQVGVA